ncbi:MAG: hypothetical protein ABEN55_22220, partial [Bradymonadaceae bacterium]
EITDRANEQLAGEMRVEGVRGPILWRLTLDDVQIRDARGTPVMHADKVRVGYSLWELLTGEVEIERVGVIRPLFVVRQYPDDSYNVYEVLAPGPAYEGSYTVASFGIDDGAMIYEDLGAEGGAKFRQKVDTWIQQVFVSGDAFDTEPVREMIGKPAGESKMPAEGSDIALASAFELDGSLVIGPGDREQLTIDDVSATLYRRSFWEPLPLVGEDMDL